jgi:hypothetical protein
LEIKFAKIGIDIEITMDGIPLEGTDKIRRSTGIGKLLGKRARIFDREKETIFGRVGNDGILIAILRVAGDEVDGALALKKDFTGGIHDAVNQARIPEMGLRVIDIDTVEESTGLILVIIIEEERRFEDGDKGITGIMMEDIVHRSDERSTLTFDKATGNGLDKILARLKRIVIETGIDITESDRREDTGIKFGLREANG